MYVEINRAVEVAVHNIENPYNPWTTEYSGNSYLENIYEKYERVTSGVCLKMGYLLEVIAHRIHMAMVKDTKWIVLEP